MRRHAGVTAAIALGAVLAGGLACRSNQTDETAPAARETAGVQATDGAVDAPSIAASDEDQAAADVARPPASGVAPAPPPEAQGRTPSRPPQAPAAGVTPSPSIGGTPPDGAARSAAAGATPTDDARERAVTRPSARLIELPAGTTVPLRLTTAVASDTSAVEDPVSARVVRDVEVDGTVAIPAGSTFDGRVTHAKASGRVKGVAELTVRFYTLTIGGRAYDIDAEPVRREASTTKGKDAQKIGIGAGAGAVVGGLLGGRKGAAIGAAAGGAGGTGVVLATKGEEVQLPAGTTLDLRLATPVVITAAEDGR